MQLVHYRGRQKSGLQNDDILIPGTPEYASLHGKGRIRLQMELWLLID